MVKASKSERLFLILFGHVDGRGVVQSGAGNGRAEAVVETLTKVVLGLCPIVPVAAAAVNGKAAPD